MALTITIAVKDLNISDAVTDAAALKVWEDALTISHVYGWSVIPISNSRARYTIVYD